MMIPRETIELVLASTNIVDLIGSYIALRRVGGAYKAICPFHTERTPSFQVNPQRQMFKCFGCGVGGSAARFVEMYENLSFPEAIRRLAARANIAIIEDRMSPEDEARFGMRKRLLAIHEAAAQYFHHQLLRKTAAATARDYLKSRGLNSEVAKSWKIGYALDSWDALLTALRSQGFGRDELEACGLFSRNEDTGSVYDRFRDRVMFPICNDIGEVIAFSGRVLQSDAKGAKYVNSPETPLFTKGSVLFGLHKSKRALIDQQSAIVCEGQIDLITAYEAGIRNVIAPQGTAFTPKQAHILKRFVEEVVLCFDSDLAGDKAADRSLPHLLAENLSIRVATMPAGEDPDSLIRKSGPDAFRERIAGARDYFAFQLDRERARPEFATPRGRTDAARRVAESISMISDGLMRDAVMMRAAQELELAPKVMKDLLRLKKPGEKTREDIVSPDDAVLDEVPPPIVLDPKVRLLCLLALRDPDSRAWIFEEPWRDVLEREPDSEMLIKVLEADIDVTNDTSVATFLAQLPPNEQDCLSGLLEDRVPKNAMVATQDSWHWLERRNLTRRRDTLHAKLRNPGLDLEGAKELQRQFLDVQARLAALR